MGAIIVNFKDIMSIKTCVNRYFKFPQNTINNTIFQVLEAPENLYKSSADYSSEEREQFVKAPDSRLRKPQALYDWEELDWNSETGINGLK